MKQIVKHQEPPYFMKWKEDFQKAVGKEPEYKDFRETPEWEQLIYDLLEEQGYICCYCMKAISGWDSHIEHFVPRNIKNTPHVHSIRAKNVELDYQNMFESCNGENNAWDHCGRLKDSEDSVVLVSPLDNRVEQRFRYDVLTGRIDVVDPGDQSAMTTIRVLGLNTRQLCEHRLSAFYVAEQKLKSGVLFDDLIDMYSMRDEQGAFLPYCAAVVWFLDHMYRGIKFQDSVDL